MEAQFIEGAYIQEGHALNCAPYFIGKHYEYCKNRMEIFIQSTDVHAWLVISNRMVKILHSYLSTNELSQEEKTIIEANSRAMRLFYSIVSCEVQNKILKCKSAFDIWGRLESVYSVSKKKTSYSSEEKVPRKRKFYSQEEESTSLENKKRKIKSFCQDLEIICEQEVDISCQLFKEREEILSTIRSQRYSKEVRRGKKISRLTKRSPLPQDLNSNFQRNFLIKETLE